MSESTVLYEAMREIIRVTVQLEVGKATSPLHEEIRSLRTQLDTRSVAPLVGPAGKDGAPGRDGVDGKDGRDGKDGERGERGADGLAGRDGAASIVPGPRGEPGERGTDGIATLEELDARIEARFAEIQVRTFADMYRGVYRSGETYKRGQFATWDGSLHLALADTTDKPMTSPAWQLVTKRGRDK